MPSEYSHKDEFPNEIDLGRTEKVPVAVGETEKPKTKTKKFYPSLYISGVKGLEGLPKDGYALIKFKRKRLSVTEGDDSGPFDTSSDEDDESRDTTTYSADLEVTELCLPDESESDGDMESSIDTMAKKAGILKGEKSDEENDKSDDEEEDGDYSEEDEEE